MDPITGLNDAESKTNYDAALRRVADRARGIAVKPPRPKDLLKGWPLDGWISTATVMRAVQLPEATVWQRLMTAARLKRVETRKEGKRRYWKWAE